MVKQLKNLVSHLLPSQQTWQLQLLSRWDTIIGSLQGKVRLEKIENNTLILGVYDACWMQELYMLSPLLINTINKSLDQPYIKHLRFRRAVAQKKTYHTLPPKNSQLISHTLTCAEKAALEKIKDPHMKKALHDFLLRCYKEKK